MTKPIAVLIIHGLGMQKENFAEPFIHSLKDSFKQYNTLEITQEPLIIKPVYWAQIFEGREEELKCKLFHGHDLHFEKLRHIMFHYLADAVAYQPLEVNDHNYMAVHNTISTALHELSEEAGYDAPLCVISHSLGTVIASNYFYDRQNSAQWKPKIINADSALERGDTLSLFYSCGTTLPLWSLRYKDFDKPIQVPSPTFASSQPDFTGEWVNFFDNDDILGYPLKPVHPAYEKVVSEDIQMNVGNWKSYWNPLSHNGYFSSQNVIDRIVQGLTRTWETVNKND
ncbi:MULTISPECIES: chemotaxis protein [Paenibacillus]|uniref:Chemotaxis protein n=1 Tax=Paenibacillus amylolyticus TaxID=1451 RepID=A0ABD8B308_PAEAM|nr:chemotaxis protein [Paenibacillus sp. GM1FR]PJN64543.1 hypothetical protein PAEAM_06290 [Paenibacillus sp. GM1FR]